MFSHGLHMFVVLAGAYYELKDPEVQQYELGYEARTRKLLVALRDKIAEKQTKGK
jgi:hypothetical protein